MQFKEKMSTIDVLYSSLWDYHYSMTIILIIMLMKILMMMMMMVIQLNN